MKSAVPGLNKKLLQARRSSPILFTSNCIAQGVPFALRAADGQTLASMLDILPFGTEIVDVGGAGGTCFTLPPQHHPRFPYLLARLEQHILLHVAVQAPDRTFLHAGVVAWRSRAILFPGRSCAGKTTLVAELVKLGAIYYSDEYAMLDSSGMVHPYPRDLRMRQPGTPHQTKVAVSSLRGEVASAPAIVAQVVFTEFAEAAEWNPRPLTPGTAILEMLPHCVSARRRTARVLMTLKAVMRTARACRSARGDAKATAELLIKAFDLERPPA